MFNPVITAYVTSNLDHKHINNLFIQLYMYSVFLYYIYVYESEGWFDGWSQSAFIVHVWPIKIKLRSLIFPRIVMWLLKSSLNIFLSVTSNLYRVTHMFIISALLFCVSDHHGIPVSPSPPLPLLSLSVLKVMVMIAHKQSVCKTQLTNLSTLLVVTLKVAPLYLFCLFFHQVP